MLWVRGAILIKNPINIEKCEIICEKGTNRKKYFRGQVDKYSWVDYGSSYLPSDILAAYLYAQLEAADKINQDRLSSWSNYYQLLTPLKDDGLIELPHVPKECKHNAHLFYIKVKDLEQRTSIIKYLNEKGIAATFHYVPLHSSPAGMKFGEFVGEDIYTTADSDRLIRLPMYYGLGEDNIKYIAGNISKYFN